MLLVRLQAVASMAGIAVGQDAEMKPGAALFSIIRGSLLLVVMTSGDHSSPSASSDALPPRAAVFSVTVFSVAKRSR